MHCLEVGPTVVCMKDVTPKYLTLSEAAIYCSLSECILRRASVRGEISHYKPCGRVLVGVADLDAYMESSRQERVSFSELAVIQWAAPR
jgi:excisionase family DNA binding protein